MMSKKHTKGKCRGKARCGQCVGITILDRETPNSEKRASSYQEWVMSPELPSFTFGSDSNAHKVTFCVLIVFSYTKILEANI